LEGTPSGLINQLSDFDKFQAQTNSQPNRSFDMVKTLTCIQLLEQNQNFGHWFVHGFTFPLKNEGV